MRVERARTEGCLPDSLPFSFVSTLSIRSYLLETDVDLTSPLRSVLLREVETIQSASPYAMKRRDGVREWVRRRTAQNARHSPPGRGSPSRGRGPQGRRTYSQRTQLEAQHAKEAAVLPSPTLFLDLRVHRRRRASVSSMKWDAHGGLARGKGGEWAAVDASHGSLMATAREGAGGVRTRGVGRRGRIACRECCGSGGFSEQQASRGSMRAARGGRPGQARAEWECRDKPREIRRPGLPISTEGRCEETLFTHSLWQRRGDASSGANELTGRVSKQACRVARGEGVRGQQREGAASGARRAGGRERRGGRGEAGGALGRDTPSTRYGEKYGEIWGEICERRAFDEQGSNADSREATVGHDAEVEVRSRPSLSACLSVAFRPSGAVGVRAEGGADTNINMPS